MSRLLALILLVSTPAWAETAPTAATAPAHKKVAKADSCTPIGQLADGQLIYSLKCKNLPAPPPKPEAAAAQAAPAAPQPARGGLFGYSTPLPDNFAYPGVPSR